MYVLINLNHDGDSYQLFTNIEDAKKAFNESKESGYYYSVCLVEATPNTKFGFGSRGDMYGAKVIEEFYD